jgi:hypothetical protein
VVVAAQTGTRPSDKSVLGHGVFWGGGGGKKPEAIIYYRDGLADSQFPTLLEHEYKAFRHVGILAEGGSPSCSACGKLLSVRVCCLLLQTEAFLGSD